MLYCIQNPKLKLHALFIHLIETVEVTHVFEFAFRIDYYQVPCTSCLILMFDDYNRRIHYVHKSFDYLISIIKKIHITYVFQVQTFVEVY